ncbi:S1C family serine protease [Candidatus Nitrosacidococcus tergens]|uniref:DegP2 peptidase, Serine peptidase, MEROPS family S01B n=1 Tax=Candidatus Nitrosacidococcus tergens TaxID=553981 RepID=A0A7G1Q963_9GAMM|nr:trypsin-like peptidase domain-containing protein [Candidatus Nitrosacidococcus tergens]CAB1275517.1 DegP2 peptidase, Serine peptidase, MEROPS family S01B [Candidatus Nitrosacidococcus tergens]
MASYQSKSTYSVFLSLLLLVLFIVTINQCESTEVPSSNPQPRSIVERGDFSSEEQATIHLFQSTSPSVVFITTLAVRRDWFSLNTQEIPKGTGSGFIWDRDGHIVTNFHVIQGSNAAKITLYDHTTWDATLVGVAPQEDLAVLKINIPQDKIQPIPIGRSNDLQVGQKTFAIGNPFGLDQTLTTGVVSALGREIESVAKVPIRNVIQTDAAINPGNSGGPLLDSSGRLIGVNTAIYSPSGAYAGIGFAIPVDTVNWVVPELIAKGKIEQPSLGVEILPSRVIENVDIEGAVILRVIPGSSAERARLKGMTRDSFGRLHLGDVIVTIENQTIRNSTDVILALKRRKPGEKVTLEVFRNNKKREVEMKLDPPLS